MKILVIGHGCDPNTGSEPGKTWNLAYHLAKTHTVYLVAHPHRRKATEEDLREHLNPNLHLNWVTVPSRLDPWDPNAGSRGIQLHYILWLRRAFQLARCLHDAIKFDVVHHVGWGTVSIPSPFWKLGIPLVWGPLGGGQVTPKELLCLYGGGKLREQLRTIRVTVLKFLPSLRRSVSKASLLVATNRETADVLRSAGARRVELLPDNAIGEAYLPAGIPPRFSRNRLTLVWAGRVIPYKGLELALRSLAVVSHEYCVKLIVAGDGSDLARCKNVASELRIGRQVEFRGEVEWKRMPSLFVEGDVFFFTSLRESFGSVVLEAMSYGLPVLALDIGGVGTFCPSEAAIKVPPLRLGETVKRFARAIERLHDSKELRLNMSLAARRFATLHTWERLVSHITERYTDLAPIPASSCHVEALPQCES
jgi:glycosyltransferase involved in cell wall biosynthesis